MRKDGINMYALLHAVLLISLCKKQIGYAFQNQAVSIFRTHMLMEINYYLLNNNMCYSYNNIN